VAEGRWKPSRKTLCAYPACRKPISTKSYATHPDTGEPVHFRCRYPEMAATAGEEAAR
jgi:hypothetical protein